VRFGTFCIDSTEVTNDQYAAFLNAQPSAAGLPDPCANQKSFVPAGTWPAPDGSKNVPVLNVDWCDAVAYCAWAGKRLCGKIGGGSNDTGDMADPAKSQWFAACSQGGVRDYPYGSTYQKGTCNGESVQAGPAAVGSLGDCVGGAPGLFDMSGNVAEWEDSCKTSDNTVVCMARGGAFNSNPTGLACDATSKETRADPQDDVGFRCCSP
jgi:formylglycine-generating enzyme required for sulfatase activity